MVKIWKNSKCPTNEWIKKMGAIHTELGRGGEKRHSAFKRKEILPFVTAWIHLEDIMPSETSQAQKYKYCRT